MALAAAVITSPARSSYDRIKLRQALTRYIIWFSRMTSLEGNLLN